MKYILDTHPLIWHLEASPRLSERVYTLLMDSQSDCVIPSIVLAEIWYLHHRQRINVSPEQIRGQILSAANCSVYPLDQAVVELLPPGLEIHDAIIVATARLFRDTLGQPVRLITCDREITSSGLIETLW